jgi:alpha-tubulin suppressor-like RCC1 family protein
MPARSRWIALISGLTFACGARTAPGIGGEAEGGRASGDAGSGGAGGLQAGAAGTAASAGSGGGVAHAARLAAGEAHTCLLLRGRLKCWGNNLLGVLGLGDTEHRGDGAGEMGASLPALAFYGDRTPARLSVGLFYGCVTDASGRLYCWGQNDSGQLGTEDAEFLGDEPGEVGPSLPPVDLGTGRTAVAVATGLHHTCALLDTGAVKCWGWNYKGELGLGDTENRGFRGVRPGEMGDHLPALELGPVPVRELHAGSGHTCALFENGAVKCWGQNAHGELGLGDDEGRGDEPGEMGADLPELAFGRGLRAVRLGVGRYHSCAVLSDGSVKCWGHNSSGELGLGDVETRGDEPGEMGDALPAVPLGVGRFAKAVSAGGNHTCAVLDDDSVKCWGANDAGQLGQGDRARRGDEPGELAGLRSVDLAGETAFQLTTGFAHTCVLLPGVRVKCWGANTYGQLGQGDVRARGDDPGEMGAALPAVDLGL